MWAGTVTLFPCARRASKNGAVLLSFSDQWEYCSVNAARKKTFPRPRNGSTYVFPLSGIKDMSFFASLALPPGYAKEGGLGVPDLGGQTFTVEVSQQLISLMETNTEI